MKGRNEIIKQTFTADNILLGLIVIAGAVLRFYDYSDLPYSFDEFSALFRARFDNFNDLIKLGVVTTDTHPAGVQVFMFYWVKLFGDKETVVKLPFILAGLGAIIIGFKIGKLWFNGTVGLFTALFLSVLQYPITYSQFARPYSSGLFLSLLMVWFWTQVVFYPERKKIFNRTGFIISAALCAYNHHFSMLLAVLAGISGLFFVKRKGVLVYMVLCLATIILYLPHLPILLAQISKGGVEDWLGKPNQDFILDYLSYILHFSKKLMIISCILIAAGLLFISRRLRETNHFRILAFTWFIITFLAGYFYSVHVNAILQFSVLIFVFPFIVMFVFSFYAEISRWWKAIIVIVFMAVAIHTLIHERKHYEIMYRSAYKEILVEAERIHSENPDKKITTVIFEPQKIREYYVNNLNINDSSYFYPDTSLSYTQFRDFIHGQTTDLLILGWVNYSFFENKLIAEEKYPYLISRKSWFKGDLYLYSREKPTGTDYEFADTILFSSVNTFDTLSKGWENVVLSWQLTEGVNYPGDMILKLNREFAFSPNFRTRLKDITQSYTNEILISVDTYMPVKMVNPSIICEFKLRGKRIDWVAGNVADFTDEPMKRLKAYLVVRLADMQHFDPDTEIWVYFWNRKLEEIFIDDFKIEVRQGNPVIYGLYEKI